MFGLAGSWGWVARAHAVPVRLVSVPAEGPPGAWPGGPCVLSGLPPGASGRREGDDRAVDDDAAGGERGALRGPVKADDDPLIGEVLDVAEIRLQRALAEGHLPLGQMRVPHRAVAALGGVPAQHVQRVEPVEDG